MAGLDLKFAKVLRRVPEGASGVTTRLQLHDAWP